MGARIWTMQLALITAFCFAMTAAPASSVDAPIALWLDAKSAQASASFGAIGGSDPAALGFDPSLQLTAQLAGQTNSSRIQLSYSKHGARYLAKIPFAAPFLLEASAVVPKVKDGTLVKYWANADRVVRPNDWFNVQDEAKAELEITLRDPWMKQPVDSQMDIDRQMPRTENAASVDQCPRGQSWYMGDACFIAVVRFNQSLFGAAEINITTYANGSALRTDMLPASALGVAVIRVPISASNTTYASVSYKQKKSGVHAGQPYEYVMHFATTSATIQR